MVKTELSQEKQLVIQGIVTGNPFFGTFAGDSAHAYHQIIFPIELSTTINATFKKSEPLILNVGTNIIVTCRSLCYIRKGDKIELIGRIAKVKLERRNETIVIHASNIYNETLQFSTDY